MVWRLRSHAAIHRARGLKVLGEACVERARRAELRRLDTDSRTVAQFKGAIERVHHDQASIEGANQRRREMMNDREVELSIERHVVGVVRATAQTAAEDLIGRV